MSVPPGSPPGGGGPGDGKTFQPGRAAPPDLKFKIFDDPVTLDAGLLKAAVALLTGKPVPPALAALINDDQNLQMWIETMLANYPVHVAGVFLISAGYIIHAGALKQSEIRNMVTRGGKTQ